MNVSVSLFKALSDETRLRIVLLLISEKELCVCDIIDAMKLPQSTVSRHLAHLRKAGLVTDRRCGNWMYYSLSDNRNAFQAGLLEFLGKSVVELESARMDRARLQEQGINTRCD